MVSLQREVSVCFESSQKLSSVFGAECLRDLVRVAPKGWADTLEVRLNDQPLQSFCFCDAYEPDMFCIGLLKEKIVECFDGASYHRLV